MGQRSYMCYIYTPANLNSYGLVVDKEEVYFKVRKSVQDIELTNNLHYCTSLHREQPMRALRKSWPSSRLNWHASTLPLSKLSMKMLVYMWTQVMDVRSKPRVTKRSGIRSWSSSFHRTHQALKNLHTNCSGEAYSCASVLFSLAYSSIVLVMAIHKAMHENLTF